MQIIRSYPKGYFSITQEAMENPWNMPYAHIHNSYEIYILASGSRRVTIDEKEYEVSAYDATLFDCEVPHTSRGNEPFSGICINIPSGYMDHYFTASAKKDLLRCFKSPVISLGAEGFAHIKNLADSFCADDKCNYIKLAAILSILNEHIPAEPVLPNRKNETEVLSEMLIQYVDDNYIRINRRRIVNACHRLKYTEVTTTKVAAQCGFESYEYFVRVFKKIQGCTPKEYRRSDLA